MKESKLFSINNKKIKTDVSNLKQIPTRFKTNLISLKSLPTSQAIAGSKSFRQQTRCFTQKNSKEKEKNSNIIESVSFELNSREKDRQKIKNKNLIMNTKNFLNYNSKINSNYLNYTNPATINNSNNLKNNGNKPNLFYIQKIDEEPQQLRINTVINTIGPSFSVSANNSISNKNKKNINNNLNFKLSCLTGWSGAFKGAIKGYNTTNNTANNSVTGSMEKNDKKDFGSKKNKKNGSKKFGKDFLKSKEVIKKINNNIEFNLLKKQNNKKNKNKFAHTTNNSRQNSGEKYLDNKSKLMALKHNKLILNNIRELNSNNNYNNNYIKSKPISTQTTIDSKINKNISQKTKNEPKGIVIKNNNCQTKNHILRKNNQDVIKLSNTNAKGKIKVMNSKLNNENINSNYLKTNIYSNLNTKSNSAFSTRQNLKVEKSKIKVNKSNKMINNNIENNNLNKGIIFKPKYKNKNLKNIDIFNVNEESLEIIKNQNQKLFPTTYFFNKVDSEINKKIMTAGNSPGRVKIKDLISPDITFSKQKLSDKIIAFQNVKQIISKECFENKKNNLNLKSAHISRKNSANKDFKEYKNIKSENKIITNHNFKNEYYYNYSHTNNSLR